MVLNVDAYHTIKVVSSVGRRSQQNVMREISGPTPYAKRYVEDEKVSSAWRLLINDTILRHIKSCTEKEAQQKSGDETWSISLYDLDAFISLIYARGAYNMSQLDLDLLWPNERFKDTCVHLCSRI